MKMKEWMMKKLPSIVVSLFAFIATVPSLADENTASASRETVEQEFRYEIPNIPGKVVTSLSVEYPPGASTPAHMHGDAFVIGYVLEGSIRSRVDGKTNVYGVGESWTENPGASHELSENASATEPAKILAIFISDARQEELVEMMK
ncbi:cupin domain-containing protein [Salinicola corii]|nr:cupin domain-containing protein [Salinicola corii]